VAPSTIPDAGHGLFTLKPRSKGEHLVDYLGEVLSKRDVERRYPKGDLGVYCLAVSSTTLLILPSPAVLAPRQMLPEVVSRPTRGLSATSLVRRRGWWPLAQYLPTERSLLRTAPATGKESVQPSPLPMFRSGNGTSPTRLSLRLLLAVFLYLMNGLLSLHQRHYHLKLPPPQHLLRRLLL